MAGWGEGMALEAVELVEGEYFAQRWWEGPPTYGYKHVVCVDGELYHWQVEDISFSLESPVARQSTRAYEVLEYCREQGQMALARLYARVGADAAGGPRVSCRGGDGWPCVGRDGVNDARTEGQ